jgi:3',5'-nucleoside bisphosphate phosphatase
MIVDLHNHSYYSDGVYSPKEVVKLAYKNGCKLIALTDHDTTDGVLEAQQSANEFQVELIHGVEISAFWQNMTIHIIGLGINIDNDKMQEGLEHNKNLRKQRAEKIAFGLRRIGIKNAFEKAQKLSKTSNMTRTHFAQMLINEGYSKDMKSVFRSYLAGKKPGSVRVQWENIDKVISWIHAAGGKAIIAHPFRYKITNKKIKYLLSDFKEFGGDGIEVVNAFSSNDEINLSAKWSKEYNFLTSCGSDFHGWPNQRNKIGELKELPNLDNAVWKYL